MLYVKMWRSRQLPRLKHLNITEHLKIQLQISIAMDHHGSAEICSESWKNTGWWFGCWLPSNLFSHILGISSSQLTNSYFSEGWPWPTNQNTLRNPLGTPSEANAPAPSWRCRRPSSCPWWARPTPCLGRGWTLRRHGMMLVKVMEIYGMNHGNLNGNWGESLYGIFDGKHKSLKSRFLQWNVETKKWGGTAGSIWSYKLCDGKYIVDHRPSSWFSNFDSTPIEAGPS